MTRGYGSNIQPSLARPSIASHKGGYPIWAAGAEMPPWKNFLRPPGNSPSRWHLTRHLLLCSGVTIHDLSGNVNTFFSKLLRNDCEKWSLNDTQNRKKMSLRGPQGRGNLLQFETNAPKICHPGRSAAESKDPFLKQKDGFFDFVGKYYAFSYFAQNDMIADSTSI